MVYPNPRGLTSKRGVLPSLSALQVPHADLLPEEAALENTGVAWGAVFKPPVSSFPPSFQSPVAPQKLRLTPPPPSLQGQGG